MSNAKEIIQRGVVLTAHRIISNPKECEFACNRFKELAMEFGFDSAIQKMTTEEFREMFIEHTKYSFDEKTGIITCEVPD